MKASEIQWWNQCWWNMKICLWEHYIKRDFLGRPIWKINKIFKRIDGGAYPKQNYQVSLILFYFHFDEGVQAFQESAIFRACVVLASLTHLLSQALARASGHRERTQVQNCNLWFLSCGHIQLRYVPLRIILFHH